MWKRLTHDNIVPFKGVTLNPFQIVLEWIPGGDLVSYINLNPRASPVKLVSLSFVLLCNTSLVSHQLVDVAKGLEYLHFYDVIHGDLKGVRPSSSSSSAASLVGTLQPNILVDASGRARITDFGSAQSREIFYQTTMSYSHTARWTAPEILDGDGEACKQTDIFSFAMVMIEVHWVNLFC